MIQALSKTFTNTETIVTEISSFQVNGVFSIPFKHAILYISLLDQNGKKYDRTLDLTGETYLEWTTDDWLIAYISERIEELYHQE